MRFHVLGLPHTQTTKDFTACAYTQKVWKFCKMMQNRGHHIIHYGHEYSDPPADELVTVITHEKWKETYGDHDYKSKFFKFNTGDAAYKEFYRNAISEIGKRKQKHDFILPFWGSGVRPICDAHPDLINVEPGIGYAGGHWARWKVFESYAIYHAWCGMEKVSNCNQDNYATVIPNYFDLDEFEFCGDKEDYFLYVGRVFNGKGVNIAIEVTQKLGIKLKIAGQLSDDYPTPDSFPDHVEYVGYVGVEERKELMKKAKASFLPSQYVEPFGGVQIENLLCGTPTITSDWGAFVENNVEGVTGYRCKTFGDYIKACQNIIEGKIDSKECRKFGEKFSLENVAPQYEKYFQDVLNVYTGSGWYTINGLEREVKENGVSFVCRTKNEAEALDNGLASMENLDVNHEIIIVMNQCTDHTEEVVDKYIAKGMPIKKFNYDVPISIPGIQHLATPQHHPSSLVSYYNFCFGKATMNHVFRWDSDFIMNKEMKEFLENIDYDSNTPQAIKFDSVVDQGKINTEVYLTNSLVRFTKDVYTQVMKYRDDSKIISTGIKIYCQDDKENPKPYWEKEPWFKGNGCPIEKKYNKIIEEQGKPHPLAFRASDPHSEEWYNFTKYEMCREYL